MADVKWSQFPSVTPSDSDDIVGLHAGGNARFSVANFVLAIRQGLANIFVPLTRTINSKSLSSDITLTMDDISNGTTYAKTTAAQVAQIGTNEADIDTIEGKIPSAASTTNQLADKAFVTDSITQGTAIFRGSFATKAALLAVAWQTTNPDAPYFVSNNDYAVVLDDETQNNECWRYIYVTGTGWTPQYRINESPLTQAQLDALNSGATAAIISSVADKLDKTGDGKDVTATFTAASTRANISTGEKLSVLFGKISKWFTDLGTAAFRAATGSITSGSTDLVESGAVYTGLAGKQNTITASGILMGDGQGGVTAAVAGTDYASASAVASLNERYTNNTTWRMNTDANDYKTSGLYAMATGNANVPSPWGILFVQGAISDTIEQEYRYAGKIWNREFRNNAWSAWTLVSSVGHKFGTWTPVNAVASATDRCCYVVSGNTVTIYMALTLSSALAATNTVTLFSNISNTIGRTIDAGMGVNAVPVVVQAYNQASRIALLYYNSNSLILNNTTGSSISTVDATVYGQITLPLE